MAVVLRFFERSVKRTFLFDRNSADRLRKRLRNANVCVNRMAEKKTERTALATIKEIARRAGVSYASVSRALNDKPGVAEKTRRRIVRLAAKMGYTPDWQARALVTGKVPLLGLVVPDITNPFYPEMIRGAEEEVFRRGYNLLLQDTAWRAERLRKAFALLQTRRVAGLLVAAPLNGVAKTLCTKNGQSDGVAASRVVLVGQAAPRKCSFAAMEVDDRRGGYLVGRHLVDSGWKRIAFVGGPRKDRSSRRRLSGLKRALREGGRNDALVAARHGKWTVESGREMAAALLEHRPRPDALFAANDLLALGAMQALAAGGLRAGRDVGVVGYDDIGWTRYLGVSLTSVAQPKHALGKRAAALLLQRIEVAEAQRDRGLDDPNASGVLEPKLVIRESCGFHARRRRVRPC